MNDHRIRRQLILGAAGAFALAAIPASWRAFAAELMRTPRQTEGPFYPLQRPAGIDNDLVHVAGQSGVASGERATVGGKVLDAAGRPVQGALVEIWQANAHGRYNDPRDNSPQPIDPRFKGYGTCMTDAEGAYVFHTIRPVAYTGRAPHIHFAVAGPAVPRLVTQMYVDGAPENGRDFVLRGLDPAERRRVIVALDKVTGSPEAAWRANFDIVVDRRTPA